MKKALLFAITMIMGLVMVACSTATTTSATVTTTTTVSTTTVTTTGTPEYVQGITDTTILVGNTAAVSGLLAGVGIPFNVGLKAAFEQVNAAGGIGGRTINFVSYDDEFNAEKGVTFTEKLVEDDKVFALVGHFGTPTVAATLNYIQTEGVPMVYAATGINALRFVGSVGNPIMAVQPIYYTEGQILTARILKEDIFGATNDQPFASDGKVGVLYVNDDAGNSIKAGIEAEAYKLGKGANFTYLAITADTASSAVNYLKAIGCQAIIMSMNQNWFPIAMTAMYDASFNVPVFTSYVSANNYYVNELQYNVARPIYMNAWVDTLSTAGYADYLEFVACINASTVLTTTEKAAYALNSYAMAGYIAAQLFIEGLQRVEAAGVDLTWASYIAAMENGVIDIPMGGAIDFSDGNRVGVDQLSLLKYVYGDNPATTDVVETTYEGFVKAREIEGLSTIEAK